MKIAITCLQLIRDLADHKAAIERAGYDIAIPSIGGQHLEGDGLVAALDGCVGVVAGDDRFTRDVIERLPSLRAISKWGVGIDGIDLAAAHEHGVVVRNTPGEFDHEVADVAMAYITMLARHLSVIDREVRRGTWAKPAGTSLRGATLGIVGLGGIGRALGVRAAAAGMKVIGCDPSPASREVADAQGVEIVEFDDVLQCGDFISINCPLTESTANMFDDAAFARVKDGVRIVNTGRGGVVDSGALARALEGGRVAGAALDVLDTEPPGSDHVLLGFDQVIFGSHNASNTFEASARVHRRAIVNLLDALEGDVE